MSSGFRVGALLHLHLHLVSLSVSVQLAGGFSYRNPAWTGDKAHLRLDSTFLRGHGPALVRASYNFAQPRGSVGSDPSYSQGSSGPAATGFYGSQPDGSNPGGSVSQYRPGPLVSSEPRETKDLWKIQTQKGNRHQLGVVSSHAIRMTSGHQSEAGPQQPGLPPRYPFWPGSPSHQAKFRPRSQQTGHLEDPPAKTQEPSYPAGNPGLYQNPRHLAQNPPQSPPDPQRPSYWANYPPQQNQFQPQHYGHRQPQQNRFQPQGDGHRQPQQNRFQAQQPSSSDSRTRGRQDVQTFASSHRRNRFDTGVASSHRIVMYSGLESKPEAQNHSKAGGLGGSQQSGPDSPL